MNPNGPIRRISRLIIIFLAAIWMMFEDWVWDNILAVMERVGRLKAVVHVEAFIAKQSPYLLLSLFLFPFLIMVPAKIYGLYLIANGKILRGVAIFIAAKVLITALVTRLFTISKEKLLMIKPYAVFYHWFQDKKEWLYSELHKLPAWQTARKQMTQFKIKLKSQLRNK